MLSLLAHAVGYKMIVGAHNTVNVRYTWEVASSSSGMADIGAYHTVETQRHARGFTNTINASEARGGSLTVFFWYGS